MRLIEEVEEVDNVESIENIAPVSPDSSKWQRFRPSPRKLLPRILIVIFLALISTELVCRYAIGLGDPPLYVADSKMEYLLQPSKTYYRFHKRFAVNRYSMRADDFPSTKSDPSEFRVLVIGDSVIYGGVLIDQADIDTEILKRELQQELKRPVVVGNASAKSWGPPNELAYLQRFGTLDADVVILELSSHDYADAPTFVPVVGVSAPYPDKKPWSALSDLFETYLLPRFFHINDVPPGVDRTLVDGTAYPQDIVECREAEREFFRFARAHNAKVALMQHLTHPEMSGDYQVGYYANQNVAKEEGVPYVDDASELRDSIRRGQHPFNSDDPLHLSTAGQRVLAHVLQAATNLALNSK
jgi:hypothetical protein